MRNHTKTKGCNRREFLTTSISGLGGIGLVGTQTHHLLASKAAEKSPSNKGILYRTLGRTGIQLPIVNMGVMNSYNPELVSESYKIGVRLFDTAWYYGRGRNETIVGEEIKRLGVRDEVIIATKIYLKDRRNLPSQEAKELFLQRFDQSLQRLQMDYVDILCLHNVDRIEQMQVPAILEAFTELKDQKKIRFAGVSTHKKQAEILIDAAKTGFWDVVLVAFNFAMADNQELLDALQNAANKDIGLIVMKTQAGASWWRPRQPSPLLKGEFNHTAMLKWALRHEFFATAIPGYTNFEQMEEDFSVAYGLDYTPEEEQFFKDKQVKYALGFCHQCERCLATCPKGVDIPSLMRTHMYAYQYNNMEHAYATFQDIAQDKSLRQCWACANCTAVCAHSVPIAQKIAALKELNLVQMA